jgi:putative hydrolase of the HAD superfamily
MMAKAPFDHVTQWVFDLDHTLYPPQNCLFDQIEVKMTNYVMQNLGLSPALSNQLRNDYWHAYGTTLSGLMKEHSIDPDPFLYDVHQIDFSVLKPDPDLGEAIANLSGRKIIYTNGTAPYAQDVLNALEIRPVFDAIYGVENAGYLPKPEPLAFENIFKKDNINPQNAAMFEDDPRNLVAPKSFGMQTILVAQSDVQKPSHVDFVTTDLTDFLRQIV